MQARERIIRARFAEHVCGHCGAHYTPESVLVLARRRSAWMVMASCPHCQRRGLFVVSFPDQTPNDSGSSEDPTMFPDAFLPTLHTIPPSAGPSPVAPAPPAPPTSPTPPTPPSAPASAEMASPTTPPPTVPSPPITVTDVNEMHQFLAQFKGNFRSLFS